MIIKDAVWLVTGASAGFGRAIVREAIVRGARVVASARNLDTLADLVAMAPNRVLGLPLDVTDAAAIDAAVSTTIAHFGCIDVLVNNAGYGLMATIEEGDDDAIRRLFDTNLFGAAALVRAVLPGMRARRSGFIVNISSTAGTRGLPGSGYYCASKAALEIFTEALSAEVAPLGIRTMIVAPGPFRTDFFSRSIDINAAEYDDYAEIAANRQHWLSMDRSQPGDPARAAAIILDVLQSDDPPVRLLLGGSAVPSAIEALEAKLAQVRACADIAKTADFPDGE